MRLLQQHCFPLIIHYPCHSYRTARREGQLRAGERGTPEAEMPGVSQPLIYPENLTLGNMAYFLAAPTLASVILPNSLQQCFFGCTVCSRSQVCCRLLCPACSQRLTGIADAAQVYQLTYPRSSRFRMRWTLW